MRGRPPRTPPEKNNANPFGHEISSLCMYVNTVYLEKALQINPFWGLYITVKFFFVCFKLRILFKMNFHLYCGRFPPLLKTQADTVPLQRPYGKQYESHCFVIVIAISAQKAPQHHTSSVWRAFTVAHPFSHLNHTLFTPSVLRGLDSCPVSSRHPPRLFDETPRKDLRSLSCVLNFV